MAKPLEPGDVVLAWFPEHAPAGHERHGARPAVVVGLPEALGEPRFPVILLTPLTTAREQEWATRSPALYPRLPANAGGLPSPSIALLDQTRALGLERVNAFLGTLRPEMYRPIREGLLRMLTAR